MFYVEPSWRLSNAEILLLKKKIIIKCGDDTGSQDHKTGPTFGLHVNTCKSFNGTFSLFNFPTSNSRMKCRNTMSTINKTTSNGEYYVILLVLEHKTVTWVKTFLKKTFELPHCTLLNSDIIHPNNCQWK